MKLGSDARGCSHLAWEPGIPQLACGSPGWLGLDLCHPPCCPRSPAKHEEKVLQPNAKYPHPTQGHSFSGQDQGTPGIKWGHQPGPGGGDGQVEDPRSLPGNLESQFSLSLLGKDAKAIRVHLHAKEGCTASSPCLRLEYEFHKA